jgi:hypothetical protein
MLVIKGEATAAGQLRARPRRLFSKDLRNRRRHAFGARRRTFLAGAAVSYDLGVKPRARGPGLKKTHALPIVSSRKVELWQCSDYRWRELFEGADVMSEGATRDEPDGKMYYGSTSIVLPFSSRGGLVPDDQAEQITRLALRDPHARLRATRIALLEAQVRSAAPIGRVRAELSASVAAHGIQVSVEVEARVHKELGDRQHAPRKTSAAPPRGKRGVHA